MFSRPPFLPVLAGVWLAPFIIALIVFPFPEPWAWFAPPPYARVLELQYRESFNADPRCYSSGADAWREIARSPHSASWFRALALEGATPAAKYYGFLGLRYVAPTEAMHAAGRLDPRSLRGEVRVWPSRTAPDPYTPQLETLEVLLHPDSLSKYARLFAIGDREAEC